MVAETPLNQASSRSHAIFTLHIEARKVGAPPGRQACSLGGWGGLGCGGGEQGWRGWMGGLRAGDAAAGGLQLPATPAASA